MGQWVAKGRAMAREFQRALEDMAREAELDKVKSEIEKAGRTDLGKTIEKTIDPSGELSKAFEPPVLDGSRRLARRQAARRRRRSRPSPRPRRRDAAAASPRAARDGAASPPAVAPAAPAASEASAAAGNGAGAATPRKRARRAAAAEGHGWARTERAGGQWDGRR